MSEKHLVRAIGAKYARMGPRKRIETIRGLRSGGALFFLKFFPRFFAEAFPERSRTAYGASESKPLPALSEKRR